ncbi:MAG: glycosyltransferase [Magnetospirillum sp.]|nr:glycosyltransferase [Magnetospirillum sp.]
MPLPFVDVIIPHLNDHERLGQCLELLMRQTYPPANFQVTVVDNGSDHPIDEVIARFPGVRALVESERGCGSARNRGVAATSGAILAFTDSDCQPAPDWIQNGVRMLSPGSGIDIIGGEVDVFAADDANPTDAELFEKVFGFECQRYVERKHFACGANIMVSRRVFEAVGPFRDASQPEDLEWGRRATRLGYRIAYGAQVIIRHPARHTLAQLRKKTERTVWHARNHMAESRWFRAKWAIYTLAMASPPLWKTVLVLTSPSLTDWPQRLRALTTLLHIRYFRVAIMARYLFMPVPPQAAPHGQRIEA